MVQDVYIAQELYVHISRWPMRLFDWLAEMYYNNGVAINEYSK